jgi:hypothetical protein
MAKTLTSYVFTLCRFICVLQKQNSQWDWDALLKIVVHVFALPLPEFPRYLYKVAIDLSLIHSPCFLFTVLAVPNWQ